MASLVGGVLFLWQSETQEMENQEMMGSLLADEYLLSVSESNINSSAEIEDSPMEGMDDLAHTVKQMLSAHWIVSWKYPLLNCAKVFLQELQVKSDAIYLVGWLLRVVRIIF